MHDGSGTTLAFSRAGDGARIELGQSGMRPRNKVSTAGVELIESFEGFRATAARLDDGRWTIGFGHTASAREGATVSREDAELLLRWDLRPAEDAVNGKVTSALSQNQYDALVAFAFNVGVDAFIHSDVLKRVNEGRYTEAALALEVWRKAEVAGDPVVLDALIRRRAAERALFLGDEITPTPTSLIRPEADPRAQAALPEVRPTETEVALTGDVAELRVIGAPAVEPEAVARHDLSQPLEALIAGAIAAERDEAPAEAGAPKAAVAPPVVAPTAWTLEAEEPAPEPTPGETAAEAPLQILDADAQDAGVEHVAPEAKVDAAPAAEPVQVEAPSVEAEPAAPAPVEAPQVEAAHVEPAHVEPTHVEPGLVESEASAWVTIASSAVAATAADAGDGHWHGPEPSCWIVTEVEAAVVEAAPEPVEAAPVAAIAAEPVAAPEPVTSAAHPASEPAPDLNRNVAENGSASRPLYSSYGPMAFAMRATTAPTEPVAETLTPAVAARAPSIPGPGHVSGPGPAAGPISDPISAPTQPVEPVAPAAAPVASAPAAAPLVLTPPPAEWDEPPGPGARLSAAAAAEADELETPLFDEGWDGPGALTGRIVHHETQVPTDARHMRVNRVAPHVLTGVIGLTALGGAAYAFYRPHVAGALDQQALMWTLVAVGGLCAATSVFFLLKNLGGQED